MKDDDGGDHDDDAAVDGGGQKILENSTCNSTHNYHLL